MIKQVNIDPYIQCYIKPDFTNQRLADSKLCYFAHRFGVYNLIMLLTSVIVAILILSTSGHQCVCLQKAQKYYMKILHDWSIVSEDTDGLVYTTDTRDHV